MHSFAYDTHTVFKLVSVVTELIRWMHSIAVVTAESQAVHHWPRCVLQSQPIHLAAIPYRYFRL
jgi:hypothetical protein